MKSNYLFPNKYKKWGWLFLIPSTIIGFIVLRLEYTPKVLDVTVPAIFVDEFFGENKLMGMVKNNIIDEILGVLVLISAILVAFSKEKIEDELISKIRLESLVWATYVNYGVLLLTILFVYSFSFMWVLIFNMYTILFFFIVRFYWQIFKLKKTTVYEE